MAIIRFRKFSAFTLAELMIIMAVMTVIIAAVAPVFTSRYKSLPDNVWSLVGASNNDDIYADAPVRSMMQQIFIGVTPSDMLTYKPASKIIVRSGHNIGGNRIQKQIELKYGDATRGYLFAGNSNLLLGGNYENLDFTYKPSAPNNPEDLNIGAGAAYNTAIGSMALNSLTVGHHNSAFGYNSLRDLTRGDFNTAAGIGSGTTLRTGSGNVLIGYNSDITKAEGSYNTVIGNDSRGNSDYNTVVGNNTSLSGKYNVALGESSFAGGKYNTALGAKSLKPATSSNYDNFNFNTAIGYSSCSGISASAKNKTCIGGVGLDDSVMSGTAQDLMKDEMNRVFIGRSAQKYKSAATLEVHSLPTTSIKYPYPGSISGAAPLNDSSVVINGNLVVRGQLYMIGKSLYPHKGDDRGYSADTVSLMGYRLYKEAESSESHKPLIGIDGSAFSKKIMDSDGLIHASYNVREHCICAYSCESKRPDADNRYIGKDSYDWSHIRSYNAPMYINNNLTYSKDIYWQAPPRCAVDPASSYIELDDSRNIYVTNSIVSGYSISEDEPKIKSCCPVLTKDGKQLYTTYSSDLKLKNIGAPYNDGSDKLSKLKIYNYTFKSDSLKLPRVGVMAQDLKRIFPNSVSKDNNGYYKIRLDEMFYSAINVVKELNSNIVKLNNQINNYLVRINNLQHENKMLKDKLLKLSKELDDLEK